MSLIYITGAPGSGKSSLQQELENRGYETHDLDNSSLGGPHNKSTNKLVTIPPTDQRTPEWFDEHEWRIYPDAIKKLKSKASEKDIYICGVAASDGEILPLFDKIFYLDIDDETLKYRLSSRADNDYGQNDFEVSEILQRKHDLDTKFTDSNVVHIDSSQSLDKVTDDIVNH